jgi:hypothetical protein
METRRDSIRPVVRPEQARALSIHWHAETSREDIPALVDAGNNQGNAYSPARNRLSAWKSIREMEGDDRYNLPPSGITTTPAVR